MGMDLNLVQLIAYTDWNETQQKQPDGSWVNYNYDWMFKPGAMKQVAEYADGIGPDYHMLIEETSQPGNIKLTGMVQDAQQNKGLLVTYLLLFAALMLIIGWEKRFFRRAAPQTAKEIA